jgi:hypothetical protein
LNTDDTAMKENRISQVVLEQYKKDLANELAKNQKLQV